MISRFIKCLVSHFFYISSTGQFLDVLNRELSAMRRACASLGDKTYKPGFTFLVAQKRHKTRLFPSNPKDAVGKAGNVAPGTVVDTIITNPTETSFFLCSHEGIQVSWLL
jgi:eukaryotic translation initiation factor 2C